MARHRGGARPRAHLPDGAAIAWLAGVVAFALLLAQSPLPRSVRIVVTLLGGMLLTQVSLAEDFAFPVFSVYLMVAGPALAAVALLQLAPRTGLRSATFWGAAALAAVASGGNAAGLALWPALVISMALQRRGREQILAMLACAVVCIAAVESGLGAPSQTLGHDTGSTAAHLWKMVVYFIHFIGLPGTQATSSPAVALAVGALVLALTAKVLAQGRWATEANSSPLPGAALALILFGLATAVMATIGRVDELAIPAVPTRYTPFATLLQLGVLLGLTREFGAFRRRAWAGATLTALVAILIFAGDLYAGHSVLRDARRIRAASAVFDRTGQTHDRIPMHPRPLFAAEVRRELAQRGLPH